MLILCPVAHWLFENINDQKKRILKQLFLKRALVLRAHTCKHFFCSVPSFMHLKMENSCSKIKKHENYCLRLHICVYRRVCVLINFAWVFMSILKCIQVCKIYLGTYVCRNMCVHVFGSKRELSVSFNRCYEHFNVFVSCRTVFPWPRTHSMG